MRWRSTGRASATTSSMLGARRPSSSARARRRQHQRLRGARPRTPGDMPAHDVVVGGLRPAAAHQGQDRVHHLLAHRHAADQRLRREQFLARSSPAPAGLGRAGGRQQHGPFRLQRRVADIDLQQEAVELRLRQRIGALLLDRVLRRQHVERPRQRRARRRRPRRAAPASPAAAPTACAGWRG